MKQILSEEFRRMQKLAGIIAENTFYDDMVKANPGWDKETAIDMVKDEYENPEDWEGIADVSGDYEEHQEYLKGVEEWFNKMQSAGPTIKQGDKVEVLDKIKRKFVPGTVERSTILQGKFMYAGSVEPNKIPGWVIRNELGQVMGIPQYEEGTMFRKID